MFTFDESQHPIVTWPVVVEQPVNLADGSASVQKSEIEVEYELLPSDAFQALAGQPDKVVLMRVVKSMKGLQGPDGKALSYSSELAEKLFVWPYIRNAVMSGYFNASSARLPEKN